MDKKLKGINEKIWLLWGGIYVVLLLSIIGYLNYTEPYSSGPVTDFIPWQLVLWGSLYLPIIVLPMAAHWKVTDFGITLSPVLALAVLITVPCALASSGMVITWRSAFIEAFARTGEEMFFRGFLILLFTRLFENKRRPWLWAAILSSLLFALAHTQTFQPLFLNQYRSPSVPVAYPIIERLINVFGIGLVFALLRIWTRSMLPGAIAHSLLKGGFPASLFVLIIYFLILFFAHRRGERVTFGIDAQAN
jgi:uncharacterized protein